MRHRKWNDIPRSVWAIGLSTFLINISTALVFALSICFMRTSLGVETGVIALLQSFVDALSQLIKVLAGMISDFVRKRKVIVLIGFILIAIAKPLLAASTTVFMVFLARSLDRFGNGVQSSPRDALVGDLAPSSCRGQCFGIKQALAVAGSFGGGVLGIILMTLTSNNYQVIFMIAMVPCILAILLWVFCVHESENTALHQASKRQPMTWQSIQFLGFNYWKLMFIVFVFMLCRFGETPLILNANLRFHMPDEFANVILMLYNGVNSFVSYPVGLLSDRIGRKIMLLTGFVVMVLSDLLLAYSSNRAGMFLGVMLWGAQMGITQSMFIAFISDFVPAHLRGTGFGLYYLINALSLACAGYIFKFSVHYAGMPLAFSVGAVISIIAFALLYTMFPASNLVRVSTAC